MNAAASDDEIAKADALVIFGVTGDLARKMTFRALYRLERAGKLDCPVIGVARRTDWGHDTLRSRARESIEETLPDFDEEIFRKLEGRLRLVSGDYGDSSTFDSLKHEIDPDGQHVFYLEVPPSLFASVVDQLGQAGLSEKARVVIEKPFGHDLASAQALQAELLKTLREEQIYRIDHFLGKEPVMDITYLRFANLMLEPVWSREYVSHVQMTMAEPFGVDDRGAFYDPVGALRDVVQNHLLQVLALVAMEPPAGNQPDSIRDKKLELFKAIKAADPDRYVRGQYKGYRDVKGVDPNSQTETFAALELSIDNWRWSGVPFYIRAGKCMPLKQTEVSVVFKRPPHLGVVGSGSLPDPNQLTVRIDPHPGSRMRFVAKAAGAERFEHADLDVLFEKIEGEEPGPYERLLSDALHGRQQLFSRMDMVEETWRIVEPLLTDQRDVEIYEPGTWGPESTDELVKGVCQWYEPWTDGEGGPPSSPS